MNASDPDSPRIEWRHVACPLCGADGSRPYQAAADYWHGIAGEFQTVRCQDCRLVYLNPQPTPETLGLCYPDDYRPHQAPLPGETPDAETELPTEDTSRQPWYLRGFVRRIPGLRSLYYWLTESYSEVIPDVDAHAPRGLELGSATGRFMLQMQQAGWEMQGVEPAAAVAAASRERGLDVHSGTIESAEFGAEHFDAAFAWMVIEHLPDPGTTLREVARVLKPGGSLAISIPNAGCWEPRLFRRYWFAWDLPRHLSHFTPRTISRLLTESGFETPTIYHQNNFLNIFVSVGTLLRVRNPDSRLGAKLHAFGDNPTMFGQLLVSPLAKFCSLMRQGGRLTVIARKSD